MEYLPERMSLRSLREAVRTCRGCDLHRFATQAVFGEGKAKARYAFVGEQPGDSEDREGRPFIGPAARVLHEAMEAAGIAPGDVYVTNAVKHFKFVERGKRRIHQKPKVFEIQACRPWLEAELRVVKPQLVVALGATAARSLMGPAFRLTEQRGTLVASPIARRVMATIHPSAILRMPGTRERHREFEHFVEDLRTAVELLHA